MKKAYIAVVISCALFVSCGPPPLPPNPPVAVNLYTVKAQTVLYYDKYPANTVALSQVQLRPEVQGYITAITFKEGSHIKKGEKLYEIDQRLYEEAYNQAKANLDVANGNLVEAQQDADRYTYLNAKDAIAKQTLDHAVITLDNAKNSVEAAKQALKMAQTNLTYSEILAPFNGTIGISQVRLGDMVTVGQTVLNTISTDDPIGVDFLVSEKQLQHFEELKDDAQKIIDSLFTIVLPNGELYPYMGKIYIIDRAVDPQTGTIDVRIVFPNPNYYLKPGMSCVMRVHNQETGPQLVVPSKAVVELMGEYFVYVAKDTVMRNPKDTTQTRSVMIATQKKVQLGQTIPPDVIIKSGINEGDRIVVDGIQSLHSGSSISVSQKGSTKGEKSKRDSLQNKKDGDGSAD